MRITSNTKKQVRNALVICNGEVLVKKAIAPLLQKSSFIVCADGGANKARELGIRPDVIIGDLDSISPQRQSSFPMLNNTRSKARYSTDLEKALDYS